MVRVLLIIVGFLFGAQSVSAHHTGVPCGPGGRSVCLPQMSASVALATLNSTGQLTWCVNARANNYPGFTSQVAQVLAQHEAVLGPRWVRIPGTYETPAAAKAAGCQVQHNMPEVHGCGECGAWVHYLNWPVLVEYRWQAGYNSTNGWLSTIGHEVVHIYGLHEHYDDINFRSFRGTYGYWAHGLSTSPGTAADSPTIMDFGTGVRDLTDYDVKQTCQLLSASFVGCIEDIPEWGETLTNGWDWWTYNNWDGTWHLTRWLVDGRTEEYRSTEGPWYCVEGCP